MTAVSFSDAFYFVLKDGDVVWPCTVDGSFRLSDRGSGHNVRGRGERDVSEMEMIEGVLEHGKASRFRSKTNPKRMKQPSHFHIGSPSFVEVHMKVAGGYIKP